MQNVGHEFGLQGVSSHDSPEAYRRQRQLHWVKFGLVLFTIPAFYLELDAVSMYLANIGRALYLLVCMGFAIHLALMLKVTRHRIAYLKRNWLDLLILVGAPVNALGHYGHWSPLEWTLRLAFAGIVLLHLVVDLRTLFSPARLFYLLAWGAMTLLLAGGGFYWLEPTVHSYADGLWLAFISSTTLGYATLGPTTPASRLFAAFIVLLGYAIMSLATASIAALFIDREEKNQRRNMRENIAEMHKGMQEMHQIIKELHAEIVSLRADVHSLQNGKTAQRKPYSSASRDISFVMSPLDERQAPCCGADVTRCGSDGASSR